MDKTECPWKEELLELIVQQISTVRFMGSKENIILWAMLSFVNWKTGLQSLTLLPIMWYAADDAGLGMLCVLATHWRLCGIACQFSQ